MSLWRLCEEEVQLFNQKQTVGFSQRPIKPDSCLAIRHKQSGQRRCKFIRQMLRCTTTKQKTVSRLFFYTWHTSNWKQNITNLYWAVSSASLSCFWRLERRQIPLNHHPSPQKNKKITCRLWATSCSYLPYTVKSRNLERTKKKKTRKNARWKRRSILLSIQLMHMIRRKRGGGALSWH